MQKGTRTITLSALCALALGALSMASAAPALADGDSGGNDATQALVDAVPRDGTGWTSGAATLIPFGSGDYGIQYRGEARGSAGPLGTATLSGGDSDGSPSIVYRPDPGAAAATAETRQRAPRPRS